MDQSRRTLFHKAVKGLQVTVVERGFKYVNLVFGHGSDHGIGIELSHNDLRPKDIRELATIINECADVVETKAIEAIRTQAKIAEVDINSLLELENEDREENESPG